MYTLVTQKGTLSACSSRIASHTSANSFQSQTAVHSNTSPERYRRSKQVTQQDHRHELPGNLACGVPRGPPAESHSRDKSLPDLAWVWSRGPIIALRWASKNSGMRCAAGLALAKLRDKNMAKFIHTYRELRPIHSLIAGHTLFFMLV